ncbi:olfactory receptor 8D1-like [Anomaloglossus baeobatrachus]|uniref:olfactory receptor 8D1-like n=1 Tax=Anomaloglossus baeobatrachus TaxID=238106 RepID=UPI003F4FC03F
MIYITTICGNLLVIILVIFTKNLHCPMYFFLTQLTALDILLTSDIVPYMLHGVLNNGSSLLLSECLIQFFFFGSFETSECLLLTVMSYDRYLAICHPLHYSSKMSPMLCSTFVVAAWLFGFIIISVQTINLSQLQFPKSNIIDHFFCELDPIMQLSTSNTLYIETLKINLCVPVVLLPFLIIVVSYGYIVHAILRMQSAVGQKAFTTCGSHLMVVFVFFGTLIFIYLISVNGNAVIARKLCSLFYTMGTPLINPIIYSLRNTDIRKAFVAFWK